MRRSTIVQAAVFVELVLAMLILLVGGGVGHRAPEHQTTFRPSTEQERRQWEDDRLYEELLRQQQRWLESRASGNGGR